MAKTRSQPYTFLPVGTRFLRLPLSFEPVRLLEDLARCRDAEWARHANQRDYTGEWTGLALRSASGAPGDLMSVAGAAGYRDTPMLTRCSYFAEILDSFFASDA